MLKATAEIQLETGQWIITKNMRFLVHPIATYVPFTYTIYRTGLPPSERNPAFLQAVFACSEHTCWRKTNNYCTALKGGRIWFVKGIIVCFNISSADFHLLLFLLFSTSFSLSLHIYLLSVILFSSQYFNSIFLLLRWYMYTEYLTIFVQYFAYSRDKNLIESRI